YFVQTKALALPIILLSIAVGLLVSAVSFANNIRDAFFDRQAGVTTMPVKMGAGRALFVFKVLVTAPYLLVALAVTLNVGLVPLLVTFFTVPGALGLTRKIGKGAQGFPALSERAAGQILPLQVIRQHQGFCLLMLVGCGLAALFLKLKLP
ncbi:MAG: prenyltransferase, partial [Chitinivibrionales bacterium]|nr:prenyltransferase [Chitinivibrionales bacterium]